MKIEKRDGSREKRIVTAMIVDKSVLARILPRWEGDMFKSRWANIVGEWCIDFYKRYEKAPKKAIEGLFQSWAEDHRDKDVIRLVEKFVDTLSGEYAILAEESQSDVIIDLASEHFNQIKYAKLAELIQGDLDAGQLEEAAKRVSGFNRVEIGLGSGVDVLQDRAALRKAVEAKREPLIVYPGALGEFYDDSLERDGFIAFMGAEKRGKTFFLMDLAWRGMLQRRRVAYFSAGDLTEAQCYRRWVARAARRSYRGKRSYKIPKKIMRDPDERCAEVKFEPRATEKAISWKESEKAFDNVMLKRVKSKDSYLKMSCHAMDTLSVAGMDSILDGWEHQGWVPDVIVCDYADIMAAPPGSGEGRDQINATWKRLRTLSQTRHCLVVTATQADAASYNVETVGRSNFSEDKRKYAHVTGMVGINQTPREKEDGLFRLNWLVLRENGFQEQKCVHVAGCLDICNPTMLSTF